MSKPTAEQEQAAQVANQLALATANLAESEALIESLRGRCVDLNLEVRKRDAQIEELAARLAAPKEDQ